MSKEQEQEKNKEQGENVVVSRADLEAFMKRLTSLEDSNKTLMAVADKARLVLEREKQEAQQGTKLIPVVRLSRIGDTGPIIIAWRMVDNESFADNTGRLVERQNIELFFEDGDSTVMKLVDFYRKQNKKVKAEIIERKSATETSGVELVVRLKDGKTLTIPEAFVN